MLSAPKHRERPAVDIAPGRFARYRQRPPEASAGDGDRRGIAR